MNITDMNILDIVNITDTTAVMMNITDFAGITANADLRFYHQTSPLGHWFTSKYVFANAANLQDVHVSSCHRHR
jgi:hypothetical protein